MTYVSDLVRGGYWPLQHHETKSIIGTDWLPERRTLRHAARIKHVRGQKRVVQQGPVTGGLVWDTKDSKAFPNIWSFAAPSAPNGSGQVSLVKGPKWSETVSGVKPMTPSFNNEQQYPAGWSAVTLAGVDFDKQNEIALAGFDGIVAPHFENIPKMGTPVWDLKGRGLGARARFQSLARLYEPPSPTKCLNWGDGHHLALQLGVSTDGAGYLVMADDPDKPTTGGLQDLATGNKRGGGPFDVGGGTCPHVHGVNARGETMRALHFTTGALFRGGIGDGPIRFQSKLYDQLVYDAPFKTKVEMLWNPERIHSWGCGVANGVWEPQGESFFTLIIPPEKPPKELIPRFPSEPLTGDADEFDPSSPPDPAKLDPSGSPLFSRTMGDVRSAPRPLYGTSLELAFPAIVGRAQHYSKLKNDLRSLGKSLSDEQIEAWSCQPATMRHEYFGAQSGDVFSETQNCIGGRYQNVPTANGGRVNMPPELGLEYLIDGFDDLTGLAYSTTYDIYWKSRLAFGTPDLSTGGYKLGYDLSYQEGTDRLRLQHTALSGVVSAQNVEFLSNGGMDVDGPITTSEIAPTDLTIPKTVITGSSSITMPYGTVYLDHTAAITVTIPENPDLSELVFKDISSSGAGVYPVTIDGFASDTIDGALTYVLNRKGGSVTIRGDEDEAACFISASHLPETCESVSGSFTAYPGVSYFVDCSGGGAEATLPDSGINDGDAITIMGDGDTDTNNITIVASGSDTINGASDITLTGEYESVRLVRCGTEWRIG